MQGQRIFALNKNPTTIYVVACTAVPNVSTNFLTTVTHHSTNAAHRLSGSKTSTSSVEHGLRAILTGFRVRLIASTTSTRFKANIVSYKRDFVHHRASGRNEILARRPGYERGSGLGKGVSRFSGIVYPKDISLDRYSRVYWESKRRDKRERIAAGQDGPPREESYGVWLTTQGWLRRRRK